MDNHENSHQVVEARLPGPGDRIDDYTVMAKEVKLDLSATPTIMQWGFRGKMVGKVLRVWQEGKRVFMRAEVNLKGISLPSNAELEFHPSFIVREMRVINGERIINAADLAHISIGYKYKSSLWKRFKAWLRKTIAYNK